jgi:hypothetical protein
LERNKWTIEFSWVKTHVGICGNELANKLAKDVACNKDTMVSINRIPNSTLYNEIEEEEATQKWQKEWEDCTKAAITHTHTHAPTHTHMCVQAHAHAHTHTHPSILQIVLPYSRTQTKIENTNNIGVHSHCLWSWENKIISAQVQTNR